MTKLSSATEKYLEAAKSRAAFYRQASRSQMRVYGDRLVWQGFSNYLGSKDPWNATGTDVAAWCANLATKGLSHRTIAGYLSILSYTFSIAGKGSLHGRPGAGIRTDNPAASSIARSTLRGIRISETRVPKLHTPLPLSVLDRLIDLQPDNTVGVRNRALYAVGWTGALTRQELQTLDVRAGGSGSGFVEFQKEGFEINLHRWAGTKQGRVWSKLCIPLRNSYPEHCAARLLREWLKRYPVDQGPLFPDVMGNEINYGQRLRFNVTSRMFRKDIAALGLPPKDFSLRSLRTGCLDWLAQEGVPFHQIARHSRLRRVDRVRQYVLPYSSIQNSPYQQTRWCE